MPKNVLTVLALVLVAAAGLLPFSDAPRATASEDAPAAEAPPAPEPLAPPSAVHAEGDLD